MPVLCAMGSTVNNVKNRELETKGQHSESAIHMSNPQPGSNITKVVGNEYVTNAIGMERKIEKTSKGNITANSLVSLSCFIITGIERAFITSIILLSKKYGFRVVADEHDGVITIGEIPDEAIEEVKKLSGFELAEFGKKDLASQSDTDEKLRLIGILQ